MTGIGTRTCIAVLLALSGGAAHAAHGGSVEDQLACTPDVYKLCAAQIPDEDAIVACLKAHKAVLSPACNKVFSAAPGDTTTVPQDDE